MKVTVKGAWQPVLLVAVNVALVLFSRMAGAEPDATSSDQAFRLAHTGQFFTVMVMTVAAGEVGVGLAFVVTLYRTRGSLNMQDAAEMRH